MKSILKASVLAVLLALTSCAHNKKCCTSDKTQCEMKESKECCKDPKQCDMKKEEVKTEAVKK
jgi:hypothetical protein